MLVGLASAAILFAFTVMAAFGLAEALATGVVRGKFRRWSRAEFPSSYWWYTACYALAFITLVVIWLQLAWNFSLDLVSTSFSGASAGQPGLTPTLGSTFSRGFTAFANRGSTTFLLPRNQT